MASTDKTRLALLRLRRTAADKKAADDEKWFKGEIEKALQILEDACDVADAPGGLSDNNGKVSAAVTDIRRNISKALDKHSRAIR